MIYLIGGPPKCGKTTLSKRLSHSFGIPWISGDALQSIVAEHTSQKKQNKKFPYRKIKKKLGRNTDILYAAYSSRQIIKFYRTAAKST